MRPSREFPQGDSNIVSVRKLLSLIFKSAKQMSLRLQSSMIERFFSLLIIGGYLRSCSSCSSVWLLSVIDSHQQPVLQSNTSPWRSRSGSAVLPAALVLVSPVQLQELLAQPRRHPRHVAAPCHRRGSPSEGVTLCSTLCRQCTGSQESQQCEEGMSGSISMGWR